MFIPVYVSEESVTPTGRMAESQDIMDYLQYQAKQIQEVIDSFSKRVAIEQAEFADTTSRLEDDICRDSKMIASVEMKIGELETELNQKIREKDKLNEQMNSNTARLNRLMVINKTEMDQRNDAERERLKKRKEHVSKKIEKIRETREKVKKLEPTASENHHSRMVEFLINSISKKEKDLECPVCFEISTVPIFCCAESHLICSTCRPKLSMCPECRMEYRDPPKVHRFAEKAAQEVEELKKELAMITGPHLENEDAVLNVAGPHEASARCMSSSEKPKPAVNRCNSIAKQITQKVVWLEKEHDKRSFLLNLLDKQMGTLTNEQTHRTLVFVKTKKGANSLYQFLSQSDWGGPAGFNVASVHGDRTLKEKEEALRRFTEGEASILVITAVGSLNLPTVRHIINYDMPVMQEYIQRITKDVKFTNMGLCTTFLNDENRILCNEFLLMRFLVDSNQEVPSWLEFRLQSRELRATRAHATHSTLYV